jgi:tryptophanyl-tRNA synthetase
MKTKEKDILLSGMQPTGPLHIGNYLGALRNWVRLQDQFAGRLFVFVADYHGMSENFDPKERQMQVLILVAEYLAAGLDPKKVTIYVQSHIPEVTELFWIFNTVTPVAFLERMTQFKDKAGRQKENINMGLFSYPVLQAADILLPKASLVPVGLDQVQHVELTRDIARFFNNRFGETFPEPKPLLTEIPKVMSLLDPEKKMSKSVPGSSIALMDEPEEIQKKLRRAVTDMGPVTDRRKKSAGIQNLFTLLREFGTSDDGVVMERAYQDGSLKYSELKDLLALRIADHLAAFRVRRAKLLANPAGLERLLATNAKKVRKMAQMTIKEVRQKVGLSA